MCIMNRRQFNVLEACSRTALLGTLQPPLHTLRHAGDALRGNHHAQQQGLRPTDKALKMGVWGEGQGRAHQEVRGDQHKAH